MSRTGSSSVHGLGGQSVWSISLKSLGRLSTFGSEDVADNSNNNLIKLIIGLAKLDNSNPMNLAHLIRDNDSQSTTTVQHRMVENFFIGCCHIVVVVVVVAVALLLLPVVAVAVAIAAAVAECSDGARSSMTSG